MGFIYLQLSYILNEMQKGTFHVIKISKLIIWRNKLKSKKNLKNFKSLKLKRVGVRDTDNKI